MLPDSISDFTLSACLLTFVLLVTSQDLHLPLVLATVTELLLIAILPSFTIPVRYVLASESLNSLSLLPRHSFPI